MTIALSPHVRASITTRRIMTDVIVALAPAGVAAIVIFGWQALALIASAVLSAVIAEELMCKVLKKKSTIGDGSAVITGLLTAYCMPANAPWWVAMLGSVFAIVLVKQLFGGLGNNFINPAAAARAFLMASWPVYMTSFMTPVLWGNVDAVASSTPLALLGWGPGAVYPYAGGYMDLFIGVIPGSLGEVSTVALLIGGIYLIARRVIDWRIPTVFFGSLALLTWAFGGDPLLSLLTGGAVLGGFFMLTDYVTSPITRWGRVIFALGAALITFAIRYWSGSYPEGMCYSILFMNVLVPLIERFIRRRAYGEVARRA